MQHYKLASGYDIPALGIGTWAMEPDRIAEALGNALDIGYTHIDTACVYGNQTEIGDALHKIGGHREELFITSKAPREQLHRAGIAEACDQALRELRCDYLDLFLLHWPSPEVPVAESMEALAALVDSEKVRSIGVSNFSQRDLEEACRVAPVPVSVNQVEYHTHLNQVALLDYCSAQQIHVTAYSPIARGKFLDDPVLETVAKAHGRSTAQVALRWLLQKGLSVVPKATSRDHIQANYDALDFALTDDDMARIDGLDAWHRCVNPDFADFGD